MERLATGPDLQRHVPLRTWAATAWGSSRAHRPGRAVDYACEFGDFSVRRAFAATIPTDASTPGSVLIGDASCLPRTPISLRHLHVALGIAQSPIRRLGAMVHMGSVAG